MEKNAKGNISKDDRVRVVKILITLQVDQKGLKDTGQRGQQQEKETKGAMLKLPTQEPKGKVKLWGWNQVN